MGLDKEIHSLVELRKHVDNLTQEAVDRRLTARALRSTDGDSLKASLQPLLDQVSPDRVSHRALRRIERNDLSVGRGLSFKAQMVAMSESRKTDAIRPSWALDRKDTAYPFLDALRVRRPRTSTTEKPFDELSISFPSVVKATRSTGARGCYLLYSEDHIVHVNDYRTLTSTSEFRSHATSLMGRSGGPKPARPLSDRWMTEELIEEDTTEHIPARDLKFYCFYGEVLLVQEVCRTPERRIAFWTGDNEPTQTGRYDDLAFAGRGITPEDLDTVQKISTAIPFPFMRIDMLNGEDELVFGEFTPRPGRYHEFNDYWDRRMGEAWARAQSRITFDMLNGKRFDSFVSSMGDVALRASDSARAR